MAETTEETSPTTFGEGPVRVEITEQGAVSRTLRVEVGAEVVDKAFDRAFRDLKKNARVKGFRPGKVPRSVLERMYGASIPQELEREIVNQTLGDALELASVAPLVEPDVEVGVHGACGDRRAALPTSGWPSKLAAGTRSVTP